MAVSPALGPARTVDLTGARVEYHDLGAGRPVVFVHGLLVNADLWREVAPEIAGAGHRCLVPTLPLGAHTIPTPDADLTPTGLADLLAEFLERLDLRDVTLVANDTGGALTQILLTRAPERIGRVVLAAVDSYETFPPQPFATLGRLAQLPGMARVITETLRVRALHRLPLVFGLITKYPVAREVTDSYLLPSRRSAAIRADLRRFLATLDNGYTLAAAEHFDRVRVPVHLVWASEDRLFPVAHAERLARDLPVVGTTFVADSYTLIPEDQPGLLTAAILEFTRLHATP
ncbi:alpha/beta fold hydrolase [Nocardia takedensis]|uniref:alpha/beta fold hydrolase n=1 Tax=Nocardia takedensis TaxID=259390 RepID=UPI0002E5874B|nr:alpha/beta hydrolase [Nocardia takedensis]